jgi:hypothetical protein
MIHEARAVLGLVREVPRARSGPLIKLSKGLRRGECRDQAGALVYGRPKNAGDRMMKNACFKAQMASTQADALRKKWNLRFCTKNL